MSWLKQTNTIADFHCDKQSHSNYETSKKKKAAGFDFSVKVITVGFLSSILGSFHVFRVIILKGIMLSAVHYTMLPNDHFVWWSAGMAHTEWAFIYSTCCPLTPADHVQFMWHFCKQKLYGKTLSWRVALVYHASLWYVSTPFPQSHYTMQKSSNGSK